MMAQYYAYLHLRESDGKPFYVGKGCRGRAWSARARNAYWHDTVAAHGWQVKIVDDGLSEDRAFELEEFLVSFIGLEALVNLTSGGGAGSSSPSEETREKLRRAMTGRVFSEESIRRMSEAAKGNRKGYGRIKSDEERAKISAKLKGHAVSEEARAKIGATSRAYTQEKGYREKMSAIKTGFRHSEEARARISAAAKAQGRKPPGTLGRAMSSATKAKLSALATARWAAKGENRGTGRVVTDGTRAKISAAKRAQFLASKTRFKHSEEAKQKMSDALRKAWARRKALLQNKEQEHG